MINKKILSRLFMCFALFIVVACEQSIIVDDAVKNSEMEAERALETISPDSSGRSPLRIENRPWYGSKAVEAKESKNLPRELTGSNALTLTFAEPQGLSAITHMIESVTQIPVSLSGAIYESSLGALANKTFLPSGGREVSGGRIVWSGSLQNLLNQIANSYEAEWSYQNGVIVLTSEQTKTFVLNALANEITLTGNASSASASSADSAIPEIEIDGTTTLEIWNEVSEAIDNIIGQQGTASYSPSTGTVVVTARPTVLRRVENYLRYQNQMRLRRIAVSLKVLSVETSDNLTLGFDLAGVIKGALGDGLTISGSSDGANGLDIGIFKSPTANTGDISAQLTADEGIRRANVVHSGSLVTLSDQPAPLQISRQIAYLERASGSGDGSGSISLEPGTIDVGLFMSVLPRIVADDRILMRLSIAITDADPNFRSLGTDEVQIELPEIDTTGFLQNAVLSNGETLVLAGFEKTTNSLDDNRNPISFLLGGSHATGKSRELLVLLINAKILPEQPLTVIAH